VTIEQTVGRMFAKVNGTLIFGRFAFQNGVGVYRKIMSNTINSTYGATRSAFSTILPAAISLFAGVSTLAAAGFMPEGSQYLAAGSPSGDQIAPALAFRGSGGWLVWQDNSTDGDGFGISARRLTSQLTGLSSFRINETGVSDQENPQVAVLKDGGAFIVWQSGSRGGQKIVGRIIKPDGKFAGPEFVISAQGTNNRDPAVAVNKEGVVTVVWSAEGVDGNMLAVQGCRFESSGTREGTPFVLNQYTKFHQRSPAITSLVDGGFVIAWISEHQRFENSVDLYARIIGADGSLPGNEFPINVSQRPCATPALVGLPSGGFIAAWAEHDGQSKGTLWDIQSRVYGVKGPIFSPALVNTRREGFQGMPHLAVTDAGVLVVYRSGGGDGIGQGVVGRWLSLDGQVSGDEFVVNTQTAGDQLDPTVASDGVNRAVVVWSTFGGASKGMDLAAQRYSRSETPLLAPGIPYIFAASSSRLVLTWPELSGLAVKSFELYVDGSDTAITLNGGIYALSGLAPNSTHSVRLAYVLQDGRKSPLSTSVAGTTWGEDANLDGLPDDWQTKYHGPNWKNWPAPSSDTDGDGVTDREEFLAGTDPKVAGSVLKTRMSATPQGVVLSWNSQPGGFYQVQYSIDLKEWVNVGSARLAAGDTDSSAVGDLPTNAYYRVNLLR